MPSQSVVRRGGFIFSGVFATAAALGAQVAWARTDIHDRYRTAVAFDLARGRLVEFTAADWQRRSTTWEWNGRDWTGMPRVGPPARTAHAMCYDAVRGYVLLFSGIGALGTDLDDTWTWDGTAWAQQRPAMSPARMHQHALCCDLSRARDVFFGRGETWEWDGQTWQHIAVAGPPRIGHAMAFDAAAGVTVMFGGRLPSVITGETWTYDGAAWTQQHPPVSPAARIMHAMAYDIGRGRTVLFGGQDGTGPFGDTWEWDGATWRQVHVVGPEPEPRATAGMAYDLGAGRVLLTGGTGPDSGFDSTYGDLWSFDGVNWREEQAASTPARGFDFGRTRAVYDAARDRVVVLGRHFSQPEFEWEWDGAAYRAPRVAPTVRPRYSFGFDAVYDEQRQRVVLCTGLATAGGAVELWQWDGSNWTTSSPPTRPSPRYGMAIGRDSRRDRIVLFGGHDNTTWFDDTWEWDGANWQAVATSARPSPRRWARMAFDRARGRMVLFGGEESIGPVADTWEWDGIAWQQRSPAVQPPALQSAHLDYDPRRQRTVLVGSSATRTEVYEWDGVDWRFRTADAAPGPCGLVGAFDGRGEFVAWRIDTATAERAVWRYGPVHAADAEAFGGNCPGGQGPVTLSLRDAALPWLGDSIVAVVSPAPTPGLAMLWYSASRSSWGGLPLPLALDPLGMPNCTLDVGLDATLLQPPVAGAAAFALQVPNAPGLLRGEVFLQAAVADAGANPAGIAMSQGLALRLGGR